MSKNVPFQQLPVAVLRNICECLKAMATSEADREYRKTLVDLVHTCRATHGPAADTIWHTIPSLAVLMFALPNRFWRTEKSSSPGAPSVLCLTAKFFVSSEPCDRLMHYASRVREVIERPYLVVIEPASLEALYDRVPQLLPTLRTFNTLQLLVLEDAHGKPRSFHGLGHQLKTLIVDYPGSSENACPPFDTDGQSPMQRAAEGLQKSIPYLRKLTVLRTGALPLCMDNLTPLGTLRGLEILDATVTVDSPSDFNPAAFLYESNDLIFFPVLREFVLRLVDGLSLLVSTTFLRFAQSRSLQTVKIETHGRLAPEDIEEFISVVGAQRSGGYIETVSLTEAPLSHVHPGNLSFLTNANVSNVRGRAITALDKDALKPLLKLTGLESLTLRWSTPTNITDKLLASMATSWPAIRVLRLDEIPGTGAGGVTYKGLLSLAAKCMELEDLGVEVTLCDCAASGRVGAVSKGRKKPERVVLDALKRFHVGKSKIEDPDAVALFLSRMFPNLESVDCWWCTALVDKCPADVTQEIETNRENWEDVDRLSRAFATVRKEKRS